MADENEIRTLERCSMHGLPSLVTMDMVGWTLRFSDGYTNRGNCVNPLQKPTEPIDPLIIRCEEFFRSYLQPTIFKLTDASLPRDIQGVLSEREYLPHSLNVDVQTADLAEFEAVESIRGTEGAQNEVQVDSRVTFPWLMGFARMSHLPPEHLNPLARMLQMIDRRSLFVRILLRGETIACGYGVLEDRYLGLYDILVGEDHRRQGTGKLVMDHLMAWGKENGAETAYLQVLHTNHPAMGLYENLGFQTCYQYWYLIKAY